MQIRVGGLEAMRRLFPGMRREDVVERWCDAVMAGDLDVVRFISEALVKERMEDGLPMAYGLTLVIDAGNMEMLKFFIEQKWFDWEDCGYGYVLNERRLIWLVEKGYWWMAMWFSRWYLGQHNVRWDESEHELAVQVCKFRTSLWVLLWKLDIPEDLMRFVDGFLF